jgi:hypothetical protein
VDKKLLRWRKRSSSTSQAILPEGVGFARPEAAGMAKKFPISPRNPHRICWGCDRFCPAHSLACGNGSERTPHPIELFGDDWHLWEIDARPIFAAPGDAGSPPDLTAERSPGCAGSLGRGEALR